MGAIETIEKQARYIVLDIETTGLLPWYGSRITCICAKDSDGEIFQSCKENEKEIIFDFIDWLNFRKDVRYFFVTKNGKAFDIPFIIARMIKHEIYHEIINYDHLDLLSYENIDLQELTSKPISLQAMAEFLGCKTKTGNGNLAIELWMTNQYDELKAYCMNDVLVTEEVFLKIMKIRGGQLSEQSK